MAAVSLCVVACCHLVRAIGLVGRGAGPVIAHLRVLCLNVADICDSFE